ncbi:MAG: hypothetical protein MHM6MM_000690 [Cercozoa sp. M6MM]
MDKSDERYRVLGRKNPHNLEEKACNPPVSLSQFRLLRKQNMEVGVAYSVEITDGQVRRVLVCIKKDDSNTPPIVLDGSCFHQGLEMCAMQCVRDDEGVKMRPLKDIEDMKVLECEHHGRVVVADRGVGRSGAKEGDTIDFVRDQSGNKRPVFKYAQRKYRAIWGRDGSIAIMTPKLDFLRNKREYQVPSDRFYDESIDCRPPGMAGLNPRLARRRRAVMGMSTTSRRPMLEDERPARRRRVMESSSSSQVTHVSDHHTIMYEDSRTNLMTPAPLPPTQQSMQSMPTQPMSSQQSFSGFPPTPMQPQPVQLHNNSTLHSNASFHNNGSFLHNSAAQGTPLDGSAFSFSAAQGTQHSNMAHTQQHSSQLQQQHDTSRRRLYPGPS